MHVDSKGKGRDSAMVRRWWSLCRVAPRCAGSKTVSFLSIDVSWVTHVKNPDQNLQNFAHCNILLISSKEHAGINTLYPVYASECPYLTVPAELVRAV
jgi:hypothetical protein